MIAAYLFATVFAERFAVQLPPRPWRLKPSSYNFDKTLTPKVLYLHKLKFTSYNPSEGAPLHNCNDVLTISSDANPGAKPATLHIQCWKNEPVVSEYVSLFEPNPSKTARTADLFFNSRGLQISPIFGRWSILLRRVSTRPCSLYIFENTENTMCAASRFKIRWTTTYISTRRLSVASSASVSTETRKAGLEVLGDSTGR